jgi:hypothetical protein
MAAKKKSHCPRIHTKIVKFEIDVCEPDEALRIISEIDHAMECKITLIPAQKGTYPILKVKGQRRHCQVIFDRLYPGIDELMEDYLV